MACLNPSISTTIYSTNTQNKSFRNERIYLHLSGIYKSNCSFSGLSLGEKGTYIAYERWVSSLSRKNGGKARKYGIFSSISSGEEVSVIGEEDEQIGFLINEFGWKVRKMTNKIDDMRKVAKVQAEAFHVPVIVFNDFFFEFFEAEVLYALMYKIRNSPPDRYACLVAEPMGSSYSDERLSGVVDVTVLRERNVLKHLNGSDEYLYVSGLAVPTEFRRQKVATVLLKACDLISILWGLSYLALHAYEDDLGAQTLYRNAGYRVVSGDWSLMTTWIGRKRRVLMIKELTSGTEMSLKPKTEVKDNIYQHN